MKNTTLPEKASNRPGSAESTVPEGTGARRAALALLRGAALVAGLALLLALLSFAGGGYSAGEVIASAQGDADAQIFRNWWSLRVERLLFAAGIGGALSLGGVAFQAVLRNPLADPYILGISGGASVGVLSAPWWWAAAGAATLAGPALAGGIAALLLFAGAAHWARVRDPATLILSGAVLNAAFGAVILLLYEVSNLGERSVGLSWVMGDLGPLQYALPGGGTRIPEILLVLALGIVTLLGISRSLDLVALGEDEAADLGIRPSSVRWAALLTGSLVTAAVVALAGPIGFIGLIIPHAVRRLGGASHRRLIPLAVLAGAVFLMVCDTIARSAIPGRALPVGIVTAFIGAPFFLVLLRRGGGRASDGAR